MEPGVSPGAAALKRQVSRVNDARMISKQPSWNQSNRPVEEPENQALSRFDASTDPAARAGAGAMLGLLPLAQTAGSEVNWWARGQAGAFRLQHACVDACHPCTCSGYPVGWLPFSHLARFGLDLTSLLRRDAVGRQETIDARIRGDAGGRGDIRGERCASRPHPNRAFTLCSPAASRHFPTGRSLCVGQETTARRL